MLEHCRGQVGVGGGEQVGWEVGGRWEVRRAGGQVGGEGQAGRREVRGRHTFGVSA